MKHQQATNNEQRTLVLIGKLYYSSNGEEDDLLKMEGADYFLAERLEEISGHTVTVRYWASDQPMTDEQRTEETIRAYTGALRSEYSVAYSEITGYLWTNEYLEVGGHDLLEELAMYIDKYLYIEVTIHG